MRTLARRRLIGFGASLAVAPPFLAATPAFAATGPMLVVWKQRGCGCCTAWARLFQDAGFVVTMHEVDDLTPARTSAGVPDALGDAIASFKEQFQSGDGDTRPVDPTSVEAGEMGDAKTQKTLATE